MRQDYLSERASSIDDIVRELNGRKSGKGYIARCPAHHDRNPSLSLNVADGKLLVNCHAGCKQTAVIDALKSLGLWPRKDCERRRAIVASYDYTDEAGQLLYQVVRTEPKGFFQRRPDGRGGWVNRKGDRQVLYRLHEVLVAPVVFVVEGEKDANSLRDQGFVATTNAGGANAPWFPHYTECLSRSEVILIPDNDVPGRNRVLTIARALLGRARRIVILELRDGKDVSEWFERGHSELELVELLARRESSE